MAHDETVASDSGFRIELIQQSDYRFEAHFDDHDIPVLLTDERAPLGGNAGPSPVRLLAVAVANCLAASLLFAMRKFKSDPGPLRAVAAVHMVRNPEKRLRGRPHRRRSASGNSRICHSPAGPNTRAVRRVLRSHTERAARVPGRRARAGQGR